MIDAIVAWDMDDDQGDVRHVADHGITMEEVEEVLLKENNPVGESRSSGRPIYIRRNVDWQTDCRRLGTGFG